MGRLEDLPAESRAELEEFATHLKEHREVAQLDCRFCLLRLSRPPAALAVERSTAPDGGDEEDSEETTSADEWRRTADAFADDIIAYLAEIQDLRATLAAQAERERALIEVVQDHALVERHTETRAHGSQDLYRMPFRGSSWFDSREAAVADWLAACAGRPAPEEPT